MNDMKSAIVTSDSESSAVPLSSPEQGFPFVCCLRIWPTA